jgi:N-acetylmuramoyl-L-alanine amidase
MPTGPSVFDANDKLRPDAAAPALPPLPDRQFALLDTPTPDPNGATAEVTPTVVPTMVPAKPLRVVIQAGHWQNSELPYQLSQFSNDGAFVGGVAEWILNLHVANLAADLLRNRGYDVRVVPATVPIGCQADVFVALHADADTDPYVQGYKAAYPRDINNPVNRRLLADMYIEYGVATGLDRSYAITLNMSGYYAFNNRTQPYAVDPSTPMLILEMGYISNDYDRQFLSTQQNVAALGVANGVDRFLQGK